MSENPNIGDTRIVAGKPKLYNVSGAAGATHHGRQRRNLLELHQEERRYSGLHPAQECEVLMSEIVTLELPDVLAQNARSVAAQTQRRIEDVLMEWLDRAATDIPVDALPDDQVLALVELQLSEAQQAELSALLAGQREGILDELERLRLAELMDIYRRGMVRKAQAVQVAVGRGLRPRLD